MRLTSDFVVSALIRRVFKDGGFAAVERKGADGAGAIFIRARHRDGTETLYAPAPQSVFEEERPERRFEVRLDRAEAEAIAGLLERETKWDPDLWVVEIEADEPGKYLSISD